MVPQVPANTLLGDRALSMSPIEFDLSTESLEEQKGARSTNLTFRTLDGC